MLVDVHAHLDHELYRDDLNDVLAHAQQAGVVAIITNGVNPTSNNNVLALAKKHPLIKASFGLYPTDLLGIPDESGMPRYTQPIDLDHEFAFFTKHKNEFISIGEVGIDYKWDKDHHDLQKQHFQRIIEFAQKVKKPLIVHSRNAEQDVLDILDSSTTKKVVLHCFMGNRKLIKRAADNKYTFSVPALIARLQHFRMLAEEVNINQLLTETDCPWLPPTPHQRNEPAFVLESAKNISEVKKLDHEEVKKNIFMNYQRMFLQHE